MPAGIPGGGGNCPENPGDIMKASWGLDAELEGKVKAGLSAAAALKVALIKFVRYAKSPIGTTVAHTFASNVKSGVPGGWGIPRIRAVAMNSPASQSVTVGARVHTYTVSTTRKTMNAERYSVRLGIIASAFVVIFEDVILNVFSFQSCTK